jgi:hypothetical protein
VNDPVVPASMGGACYCRFSSVRSKKHPNTRQKHDEKYRQCVFCRSLERAVRIRDQAPQGIVWISSPKMRVCLAFVYPVDKQNNHQQEGDDYDREENLYPKRHSALAAFQPMRKIWDQKHEQNQSAYSKQLVSKQAFFPMMK